MKKFLVGGAVRDTLMGGIPKDKDYVVVGSTPEEMVSLGFSQVGADFPVFLHPETGEEYALARVERKVGIGYQGFACEFSPDVTLEDDLFRRDLTINAIAFDEETGQYIDPYGGIADIKAGVLRHVSKHFEEDPLRVLRVCRFAARYGFKVHPETMMMMRRVVATEDFASLSDERIYTEFMKALGEEQSSQFIKVLNDASGIGYAFGVSEHDARSILVKHVEIDEFNDAETKLLFLLFDITPTGRKNFEKKFKLPANFKMLLEKTAMFEESYSLALEGFLSSIHKDQIVENLMMMFKGMDIVRRPFILKTFLEVMTNYHHRECFSYFVSECAAAVRKALKEATIPDGVVGSKIRDFMNDVTLATITVYVDENVY